MFSDAVPTAPSAVMTERVLKRDNGELADSPEDWGDADGHLRTESSKTLVGAPLEPLVRRPDPNAPPDPAAIWDKEAGQLLGPDTVGKDEAGELHHTNLSPSDPFNAPTILEQQNAFDVPESSKRGDVNNGSVKARQEDHQAPPASAKQAKEAPKTQKLSEEIVTRSIEANKPLIAIPGVPEARDRNGNPLPTPALPPSIRDCVEKRHLPTAHDHSEEQPLIKMSRHEHLFLGAVVGLTSAGWIVGTFGLSLIWLLIVAGAGAGAIHNWRIKEAKRVDWEHHHVEGALSLGSNVETAEWLNFFVSQIWTILNPDIFVALTDQIEDQSNLLAATMLKGFVFNISCREFDLGPHAPRITSIQVYPEASGEDSILMDLTMSLEAPAQLSGPDMSKLGMNLTISMDMGSPTVGNVTVPVLVEVSQLELKVRVHLTLSSAPPFLKEMRMSFLAEPVVGIGIKPLKLVNLANIPVIDAFILTSITSAMNELALAPRVLRLDLEALLTGQEISSDTKSLGVVKCVIHSTVGTRKTDTLSESDQYVMVSLESTSKPVARCRVVADDPRPVWEDTHHVLVNEDNVRSDMVVTMSVWDWDANSPDEFVGKIHFSVRELIDNHGPYFKGWKQLTKEDSDEIVEGWIYCEIGFFPKTEREEVPIVTFESLGEEQRKKEKRPGPEYNSGILGILVHQGAEIAVRKKDAMFDYVNSYARVYIDDIATFKTRTKAHHPAPFWNVAIERFVADYRNAVVRIVVKDERPREWDPVIGVAVIKVADLLDIAKGKRTDTRWHQLEGGIGFGKLRISFVFRSVQMVEPPNLTTYNVGTLVFGHFQARNLDQLCDSTPSPYLDFRLSLAADTEWTRKTTPVVKRSANPTWPDEVVVPYRTLHRSQAVIQIGVRDHKGLIRAKEIAAASFFAQDVGELAEWFEVDLEKLRSKDECAKDLRRHAPARIPHVQDVEGYKSKNEGKSEDGIDHQDAEAELQAERLGHQQIIAADSPLLPLISSDSPLNRREPGAVPPQIEFLKSHPDPQTRVLSSLDDATTDRPVLIFKAAFRPGLSWVEAIRSGEEYEIAQLRGIKDKEKGGSHDKKGKWLGRGGSTIKSGEPARSARDDKRLPGNAFTRSIAWSLGLGGQAASKISSGIWVARKERHLPDLPVENE